MKLRTFIHIPFYLLLFLCTSCFFLNGNDDDFNDVTCDPYANGSTNQGQLLFIEPERDIHFSFITLTASISIPNTFTFFDIDEVDLLESSSMLEAKLVGFNHKDITLGNEINVLKGRLEDDGSAFLIYSEETDSYELRFEITLERLGEYTITNHDALFVLFDTIPDGCSFRINTSSQRRFFVEQ